MPLAFNPYDLDLPTSVRNLSSLHLALDLLKLSRRKVDMMFPSGDLPWPAEPWSRRLFGGNSDQWAMLYAVPWDEGDEMREVRDASDINLLDEVSNDIEHGSTPYGEKVIESLDHDRATYVLVKIINLDGGIVIPVLDQIGPMLVVWLATSSRGDGTLSPSHLEEHIEMVLETYLDNLHVTFTDNTMRSWVIGQLKTARVWELTSTGPLFTIGDVSAAATAAGYRAEMVDNGLHVTDTWIPRAGPGEP